MVAAWVLEVSLAVLAGLFAGAAIFLTAHGLWLRARHRWSAERLAAGRAALHAVLLEGARGRELEILRRLPPSLRTRVVLDLSRSVTGETRAALGRVAEELGVLGIARVRLRSRHWWRRLHAVRTLQTLEVGVVRFRALLRDPSSAVRAQAAEWAGEHPDPDVARALLEVLTGSDPFSRFTVQDSLLRLGAAAVQPLAEFLARHDGPEVVPALEVAASLAQAPFAAPAVRLCGSTRPEVRALAAELLGAVGGRDGTETLVALLDDPEAPVRAAAAHALGRIGHWPSGVAIARRLRDPAWAVRQAAGLALRSLGSPGELLLRRYRDDDDRFAADMARRVLELPAGVRSAG